MGGHGALFFSIISSFDHSFYGWAAPRAMSPSVGFSSSLTSSLNLVFLLSRFCLGRPEGLLLASPLGAVLEEVLPGLDSVLAPLASGIQSVGCPS